MHTVEKGMDKIISIVNTQVINIPKFRVQNKNKKSSRQIIKHGCKMVHNMYSRIKSAIKHVVGHMINLTSCLLSICCVGLVSIYMWAVEFKVCMCLVSDNYIPHFHLELYCDVSF